MIVSCPEAKLPYNVISFSAVEKYRPDLVAHNKNPNPNGFGFSLLLVNTLDISFDPNFLALKTGKIQIFRSQVSTIRINTRWIYHIVHHIDLQIKKMIQ